MLLEIRSQSSWTVVNKTNGPQFGRYFKCNGKSFLSGRVKRLNSTPLRALRVKCRGKEAGLDTLAISLGERWLNLCLWDNPHENKIR